MFRDTKKTESHLYNNSDNDFKIPSYHKISPHIPYFFGTKVILVPKHYENHDI